MNTTKQAIERVVQKRKQRGASERDIHAYKNHLLTVWKNSAEMTNFIKGVEA